MINDNDIITAVQSKYLFENVDLDKFKGFVPADKLDSGYLADFRQIILDKFEPMTHNDAFKDENYREIGACFFIVNPDRRLISSYRTGPSAKKGADPSSGVWSCGYKGHVKSIDAAVKETSITDPILSTGYDSLINEIQLINGSINLNGAKLLGYINNDHNKLSKTHFTLVYGVLTDSSEIINPEANLNKQIYLCQLDNMIKQSKTDYWTNESYPALYKFVNAVGIINHD